MLAFARLSFSLLISSVILASAVPVESSEPDLLLLTPNDFDSTISNGVWFVEHFSPYCGHCRKFAPTWAQLVQENQGKADPGIHLAQVNCAVHGDLCRKNNVDGYPQMNLYKNGKYVDTFRKAREFDILAKYIASHAEPTNPPPPRLEPTQEAAPSTPPAEDELLEEVVRHDNINPTGLVVSLDEANFQKTIDQGHVFIKFFAPWCGHCKKLAPVWTQLAGLMQHKLNVAEVDCDDHPALCKAEGVTGYPTLLYYAGGKNGKTDFAGGRKLEQLKAFADKVSGPTVQELHFDDLQARVAEHDVIYLFLHSHNDRLLFNQVVDASNILFGSPPLYASTSSSFYNHFNLQEGQAVILALKDHDSTAPLAVYTFQRQPSTIEGKEELANWLLRNRLPSAVQLDSDNFQEVMNAPHKPLVVIAATSQQDMQKTANEVTALARKWRDAKEKAPVIFTWMDADKWGKWLRSMYGIKAGKTIVANHSHLLYYDVDPFGETVKLTSASLFPTINGAAHGTLASKNSENMVERLARYLNTQLVSLSTYIRENPWHTAFFGIAVIAALIMGVRRLLADTEESREGGYMRKGDRVD